MKRRPAPGAAVALLSIAATTLSACAAEPPSRPAWDVDVLPILQGSCNHCHGETVGALDPATGMRRPGPLSRLDICDPGSDLIKQAGPAGMNILGGAVSLVPDTVKGYLEPVKGSTRASMPPPPALPLTEYELEVFRRWAKIVMVDRSAACQKSARNHPPIVRVLDGPRQEGSDAFAIIEIKDSDQVIGTASVGDVTVAIPGSGRRRLVFPGASAGQGLRGEVTDGYVRISF